MNTPQKVYAIRSRCIAANPEIGELKTFECGSCGADDQQFYRPIRLADVLLAIGSGVRLEEQTSSGQLSIGVAGKGWTLYNLLEDDLTKQSQETIDFLTDLLTPKGEPSKEQ